MVKKILIIGGILVVIGVVIIMVIPWGEYESDIERSEIKDKTEYQSDTSDQKEISLNKLEGLYTVDIAKGGTAEILFNTKGLKATKGGFEDFNISFDVPENYKNASLKVSIKTTSINTGNEMRDEHLLEAEFFHAEAYPEINFTSSQIEMGDTSYIAKGELTLNGTTKTLDVPFLHLGAGGTDEDGFEAFEGAFEIDRTEYGQEESSGVGNVVKLNFYCELKKQ